MRTTYLLIGMLMGVLGAGCGESNDEPSQGAAGAAGDDNATATGGKSGSEDEATGGKPNDDQPAEGGESGNEEDAGGEAGDAATDSGGSPGAGGDSTGAAGAHDATDSEGAGAGGVPDDGEGAAGSAGAPDDPGGNDEELFGFAIRNPAERSVTCSEAREDVTEPAILTDEDYVCTFANGAVEGHVYVQATPTDCRVLMGATPTTFTTNGWLSIDDVTMPLDNVAYDHGGNHFNNTIEIDYHGRRYRFAHSSIGFGGRACQPPDCLQVFEQDGTTLIEDGCTVDRTLPVTCVAVEPEAVVPSLEGTFEPCPGDPNYEE